MEKGTLRIYMGSAPGVGKTYAMLNEGWRRKKRGHDVVVGYVETHNRQNTREQIRDLEVIPRIIVSYKGTDVEEMDVASIIARKPETILIDELAHTNAGLKNEKRWQDVEEIRDAGINVVTTVNVQHLESLNDIVERITGIAQRETVPDRIVRAADQIELVDMSPDALRRRMAHGNIYAPEKVDAALGNFFRPANLTALRELALLWVADRVDDALNEYRDRFGIENVWETRERVVVAISGSHLDETVLRRAARMASRSHAELIGLHVRKDDGLSGGNSSELEAQKELIAEMGGEYREIVASDVAQALVQFANSQNATQIVIGSSTHSSLFRLVYGSVVNRVVQLSGDIDVHIVSFISGGEKHNKLLPRRSLIAIPRRRQFIAVLFSLCALPLATIGLIQSDALIDNPIVVLLFMLITVIASAIGGAYIGISCAFISSLVVNWFFTPPIHTFTITSTHNIFSLVIFLCVAAIISLLVDVAARKSYQAKRGQAEAESLARFAGAMIEPNPLEHLLEFLCSAFGMNAAAVVRKADSIWEIEASFGDPISARPDAWDTSLSIDEKTRLVFLGEEFHADDQRIITALCAQLSVALKSRRESREAKAISQTNDLRAALLQAVSHDLRTPLSSIKASVSSLRQDDVEFSEEDSAEFLATIEEETDRLNRLVGNLLDMSRLNAQVVEPAMRLTGLEEIIPLAIASVGNPQVVIEMSEELPLVNVDPALLERAVANLVDNAAKWAPEGEPPHIDASRIGDGVHLRVIDHGKGIPIDQREKVFQPFQRLSDIPQDLGAGLGLAVARGFVEACGGRLWVDDTPGGGATMTIELRTS